MEKKKEKDAKQLGYVLKEMAIVSLKASPEEVSFGHPCSHLINCGLTRGIASIAEDLVNRPGEFRLNGAGLKIYTSYSYSESGSIRAKVCGDQYNRYPQTGPVLNKILQDGGLQERGE